MYRLDSILRRDSNGSYNSYWRAVFSPRVGLNKYKDVTFRVQNIDTEEYTIFDVKQMFDNVKRGNIAFQVNCNGSRVVSVTSKRAARCIDKFWYIGAEDPSWGMPRDSEESFKFRDLNICIDVFKHSDETIMKSLVLFTFNISGFCSNMMHSDELILLDIMGYGYETGADTLEDKGESVCTTVIDLLYLKPKYFMFYNGKVYLKGGTVSVYAFGYDSKLLLEML